MDPDSARDIVRRHQPSRWWRLLGERRCRACGRPWRCDPHINAVDELNRADEPRLAEWTSRAVRAQDAGQRLPSWHGWNSRNWP